MDTLTMQAIRAQYPTPQVYRTDLTHEELYESCYCIGGSVLLAHHFGKAYSHTPRFPAAEDLRAVLPRDQPRIRRPDR